MGKSTRNRTSRSEKEESQPSENECRSPFRLAPEEVERRLESPRHDDELRLLFGDPLYNELRSLKVATRSRQRGPAKGKVLILPGILGSQIGLPKKWNLFNDVYWLDPIEIFSGQLARMALDQPQGKRMTSLGVLVSFYLRMKLSLEFKGFDADFFHYDWRKGIAESGKALSEFIASQKGKVRLVAHSMGGLVSRVALTHKQASERIEQLIMLGTPNFGSYAPVTVLRARNDLFRKVVALDLFNSSKDYVETFRSFPGLLEMMPGTGRSPIDFFDASNWPARPVSIPPEVLSAARKGQQVVENALPALDSRCVMIAGYNQPTVVSVRRDGDSFVYSRSWKGDGTVPLDLAVPDQVTTYYTDLAAHGNLPNNRGIINAVAELLVQSPKRIASGRFVPSVPGVHALTQEELEKRIITTSLDDLRDPDEKRLEAMAATRVRTRAFVPVETALEAASDFLGRGDLTPSAGPAATAVGDGFLSADAAAAAILAQGALGASSDFAGGTPVGAGHPSIPAKAATASSFDHSTLGTRNLDGIIVSRRKLRRLEIELAKGNITEVRARAVAIGVFQGVTPAGPASAINEATDGIVWEYFTRRMFSGAAGEISAIPLARRRMRAESLLLVGLGLFDAFSPDISTLAAANAIRALAMAGVEEVATVMLGAGTGLPISHVLGAMMQGVLQGLADVDGNQNFRRIIICENDEQRYQSLRQAMYNLITHSTFNETEITILEEELPPPLISSKQAGRALYATDTGNTAWLMVRQSLPREGLVTLDASLLLSEGKATVLHSSIQTSEDQIIDFLAEFAWVVQYDQKRVKELGSDLATRFLPPVIVEALGKLGKNPLVVLHDELGSRIPWEVLRIDEYRPVLNGGLIRRHLTRNLSVAKWLEARRFGRVLSMLLVLNPTGDLDGAEKEGKRIREIMEKLGPLARLTILEYQDATKARLLKEFSSGEYDVIHYAGHAQFDVATPSQSGVLCYGNEMLTGADLSSLSRLPALVFFNACESGRLRKAPGGVRSRKTLTPEKRISEGPSLAEAFLRGGVANYIGTYWPVGDEAAEKFATAFYTALTNCETLGDALLAGRKAIDQDRSPDWANYMLYGSPEFRIKAGENRSGQRVSDQESRETIRLLQ